MDAGGQNEERTRMPDEKLAYRISEVAETLGCSRAKAYEMVASGEIPSIRIGSLRRVPAVALRKMIDKQLAKSSDR
jgi:excisionase family DNA binding protein